MTFSMYLALEQTYSLLELRWISTSKLISMETWRFQDKKTGITVMEGQKIGKSLFHMKFIAVNANEDVKANSAKSKNSLTLWHQRFGHASKKVIQKMATTGAVEGLN